MWKKTLTTVTIIVAIYQLTGINCAKNLTRLQLNLCNQTKIDQCSARLVPITDPILLSNPPTTIDSINKWCQSIRPLENCIKDYANQCVTSYGLQKSLLIVSYSLARNNRKYCTNNQRKKILIEIGKCAGIYSQYYSNLTKSFTAELHSIKYYSNQKLRIPLACCSYFRFKEIVLNQIENQCSNIINEIEQLLQSYGNDVLYFACGDYTEDSDKCSKIIDQIPKWNYELKWNSFILPMIELFDCLE